MRLHALSVQAFGPFAGTEGVDFDGLSADGLFLLHGRTGAGKTSVLDAVCFALYGAVPGARSGGAPDLRSHHAAPDLPPRVVLELTASGRRLRIERSPAWQRPKLRGAGTTTEQARTLLAEHAPGAPDAGDDGWRPLSSRNDEASQLLTDVLGMGLAQFATVVLLPQGEFATFLRAGANERRELLQRLFATDRFERAERWLVAERARTATAVERASTALGSALERAEHLAAEWASHAGTPEQPDQLSEPGPEQVAARVELLAGTVASAAREAEHQHRVAAAAARDAVDLRHRARVVAQRAQRVAQLITEQQRLDATAPAVTARRAELAAATAALGLEGHLAAASAAERAAAEAGAVTASAASALARVAGHDAAAPPETSSAALRERATAHRREQGRLAELVALETDLTDRERQSRAVAADRERLDAERAGLAERLERSAQRRTDLSASLEEHTGPAATAAGASTALSAAQQLLEHARRADALSAQLTPARAGAAAAAHAALAARAGWLDARQARLDGVAAELAARLEAGSPCPVCGACEHPAPAAPPSADSATTASPTSAAAAEQEAQQRWELADADSRGAQQRLSDLERDAASARGLAGGLDGEAAAAALAGAQTRATAAQAAVAAMASARAELAALQDVEAADAASLRTADEALTRLAERAEQLAGGLTRDRDRLRAARGDDAAISARADRLAALADAAETTAAALEAEVTARAAAQAASSAAGSAAVRAGFTDLADAARAQRSGSERAALEEAVAAHERASTAVQAQLAELSAAGGDDDESGGDPDGPDRASVPADPLEALAELERAEHAGARAEAAAEGALRAAERAASAAGSLERLADDVRVRADAAAPLVRASDLAADLARCAEGSGGGNARRMKLSTFVLAARLEQVAVAASERLEVMSDGRYRLVHSDALERRGAASGLGLRVLDAWTGVERDVATLSGGETFMASLALALGLADVVRAEGGGAPVETLFVDEGFGTLDPESLEEVMGVLEQLRAGGRAVGLVSHVPELRVRVPARLEVVRTSSGSRLSTVLA